jgi:hypothetical protein
MHRTLHRGDLLLAWRMHGRCFLRPHQTAGWRLRLQDIVEVLGLEQKLGLAIYKQLDARHAMLWAR